MEIRHCEYCGRAFRTNSSGSARSHYCSERCYRLSGAKESDDNFVSMVLPCIPSFFMVATFVNVFDMDIGNLAIFISTIVAAIVFNILIKLIDRFINSKLATVLKVLYYLFPVIFFLVRTFY